MDRTDALDLKEIANEFIAKIQGFCTSDLV